MLEIATRFKTPTTNPSDSILLTFKKRKNADSLKTRYRNPEKPETIVYPNSAFNQSKELDEKNIAGYYLDLMADRPLVLISLASILGRLWSCCLPGSTCFQSMAVLKMRWSLNS